jgi:GH35 family endo-1,4-beta-xylanase
MLEDVVMWGFTDRYSWITAGETFPDHAAGVMFDRDLRPRPSYVLVRRALGDGFE